mgnify:CR=1 FL=1
MHQRAAQRELLLHPAGERAGAPVAERLDLAVDRRDRLVSVLEARAEDGGEELEVLPHAQVRVEREATGHVADAGPDVPEVPDDVAPEHLRPPGVRDEERGEDTEERGLAGAVRADDAEDLGGADVEGDAVERGPPAEALDEPLRPDREFAAHGWSAPPKLTSAGIPILSRPSAFGTRILTA